MPLRGTPINYEPKRPNRFLLEFPTELGIESWLVQTSGRPKITIAAKDIPYFNQVRYIAGNVTFGSITIKLIDHIAPSSTQKLMEWVRLHHEPLTNRSGYAATYKKTLILKDLDPVDVEISKFILVNCQITEATFGEDNDYTNDSYQTVSFTVQPDVVENAY